MDTIFAYGLLSMKEVRNFWALKGTIETNIALLCGEPARRTRERSDRQYDAGAFFILAI